MLKIITRKMIESMEITVNEEIFQTICFLMRAIFCFISRTFQYLNSKKLKQLQKTILRNDFGGWLQNSAFENRKEREHDNG
jgi:hypothetical protein